MRHAGVTFDPAASACDMPGRQGRLPSLPGASAGVPASLSAFAAAFAGVPASLSAFAVAFAGVPQVSRHLPWRLREFPQVSRHLPWRLRESRKSLGICRGVCAGGASLSAFAAAFAQAAQVSRCLPWRLRRRRGVSRHLPRRLRKRRKSLGVCRGVCASGASLSAFARPGFLTALPRAGRWGVCWASSRRPTRGERRRRRGLHSARSAGC